MANSLQPVPSDRSKLLLDFPIRFYTALRTIRLYPATNPQVQRSNTMLLQSFQELLQSGGEESIEIAVAEQHLFVCGEHLPDKDQTRPQIQGLIALFSHAKIHSLSFFSSLSSGECIQLTQTLSSLLAEKDVSESMSAMLDKAGIVSVTADCKRYVAIHEGEQVVREELLGSDLNISEEELADFILGGNRDGSTVVGVSREMVEALINRLPVPDTETGGTESARADTAAVIDFLKELSREQDGRQDSAITAQATETLSNLDPTLLARLVTNLPRSPNTDEILGAALDTLSPQRLNALIARLVSQQPATPEEEQGANAGEIQPGNLPTALQRLIAIEPGRQTEISRSVAQNTDAKRLLLSPETTFAELPEDVLDRLHQPEWSAPVLAAAVQQVTASQDDPENQVDFSAFNRMLGQYELLLDQEQQNIVARQAGAQLVSMEGMALGNILTQKFKGLFGQRLYEQVMSQVSAELLDKTVERLTPRQLNRMVAMLTSDIPLDIGKEGDTDYRPTDNALLKRLVATKKGPEIKRTIAQNVDARTLLLNPEATISELPEHLRDRLHQPEWSAPVLAAAAQQVTASQDDPENQVDLSAFNRMLGQYELLLDQEQQNLVARQAGAQLAAMEGMALGNILTQKFRGLFGQRLYEQVITQVSDELLDETVEHLTPKQLNRMVAMLTSDIPLHIGKEGDPNFQPVDNTLLKRLAQSKKGSEISKMIGQNIDARHILQAGGQSSPVADQVASRLRQPEWSAPVLVAATRQIMDQEDSQPDADAPTPLAAFEQMLDRYNSLLSREEQVQVANRAGAQLASFDEQELGHILVKRYKNLFGEHLYQQVIAQLSPEKIERLTNQFRDLAGGRTPRPAELSDVDAEESYRNLMETIRSEKMRAIIALHRERKAHQEKERKVLIERSLDSLLNGHFNALENHTVANALPEQVRNLLLNHEETAADNLLMQLAIGLSHQQPVIRENAFKALAATAEHLARIGQWQRFAKLLPALQQGLQHEEIETASCQQALAAIGALAGYYLTQEIYVSAFDTVHYLQTLTGSKGPAHVQAQAKETLKRLCTEPVLNQLIDHFLHSEKHQEIVGKILVNLGPESAKFQLRQLFDSDSRFERKHLLLLIQQTGNPAVSLLLEQLQNDSPWYVLRNVIRLLGEIGNPELFSRIRLFIDHRDPRVQQEVIGAAVKIGGDDLKDFLLHALQNIDDSLKIRVINHIATSHDERFVRPLTDLLESTKPFLGKNKNDLQISLCKALGAIGSKRATGSLNRVVQSKTMLGLTGYADEVREAAGHALHQIRLADHDRDDEPLGGPDEGNMETATTVVPTIQSVRASEEAIFELARTGREAEAKEQLLDLIAVTAGAGDLATAQRLRERIQEIAPQAPSDIIRGEEIIEPERQEDFSEEDLEIWANLTDQLGTREFRAIYEAFDERRYKAEETIVSQGDKNDALFFINQGSVKVSHLVGERELFITSLSRGQLAGENFFTSSLWTVTLTSLTPTRLYVLPQSAIATWKEQFPHLRAKLQAYYQVYNNIGSMLKKKGLDRRQDQRFTLSRKIQVQPISTLDAPIGRGFRSETADLSQGGMSFLVRIAHQENARLLLGRRMQVVLPVGGKIGHMHIKGLVNGIQPYRQLIGQFSVHFRFDRPMDNQELQVILG